MDQGLRLPGPVSPTLLFKPQSITQYTNPTSKPQILPRGHVRDIRVLLDGGRHRGVHRHRLVPLRDLRAPDVLAVHPLGRARVRDPEHAVDREEPLGILCARQGLGRAR